MYLIFFYYILYILERSEGDKLRFRRRKAQVRRFLCTFDFVEGTSARK